MVSSSSHCRWCSARQRWKSGTRWSRWCPPAVIVVRVQLVGGPGLGHVFVLHLNASPSDKGTPKGSPFSSLSGAVRLGNLKYQKSSLRASSVALSCLARGVPCVWRTLSNMPTAQLDLNFQSGLEDFQHGDLIVLFTLGLSFFASTGSRGRAETNGKVSSRQQYVRDTDRVIWSHSQIMLRDQGC